MARSPRTRSSEGDAPRGHQYDRRFLALAAQGNDVHGEASFVASLDARRVLDAGCGTGRVAIELARRGFDVVGVDLDPEMLRTARLKAPSLEWIEADIAEVSVSGSFDVVVMAGNVLLFAEDGTEGRVIANLARHLAPNGRLVSGFSLTPGRIDVSAYESFAAAANLDRESLWSSWDREPFEQGSNYALLVHRLRADEPSI